MSFIMILGRASLVACLALTQVLASAQTEAPFAVSENASAESAAAATVTNLSPNQILALIYKAVENSFNSWHDVRNYTLTTRTESQDFKSNGELKSKATETYEIMILYGEPLERLIARDDKPLSEKEAGREEKRVRGIVRKREREGEEKRKKRLAKEEEKERKESADFLAEFTEAFSFSLAGIELVEGHEVYVIEAEPRLRYEPHDKFLKTVRHFHFQAWIDKLETQWVKLNAECIKDFSIGLFLGRVNKGTSFMIEETKVNDEVWLPKRYLIRLRGRVLLFSTQLSTINMTFSDYKKFRADTKIVPLGEGKE